MDLKGISFPTARDLVDEVLRDESALTYGSVCTGIGGFDAALDSAGFKCAWQIEIDEKCRLILKRHWPDAPQANDMRQEGAKTLRRINILAGGTPCQAFSIAGLRNSLKDDRGNLTIEFCRLADEFDPQLIIWENVPGVLSTPDNAFGCFLAGLVGADAPLVPPTSMHGWKRNSASKEYYSWPNAGMVVGPTRTAVWRVLDAQYFGLAQRRERVFVVACPGDASGLDAEASRKLGSGFSPLPAQILFEPEGLRRHHPPRREAWKDITHEIAPCPGASGRGFSRAGDTRGQDAVVAESYTLAFGANNRNPVEVSHALNAHPTGRLDFESEVFVTTIPVEAYRTNAAGQVDSQGDKAAAVTQATDPTYQFVATGLGGGDLGFALRAGASHSGDKGDGGINTNLAASSMAVRRLTPTECARLQGFPDDWNETGVCEAGESVPMSDSARYKQFGNAVAVSCVRWIAKRAAAVLSQVSRASKSQQNRKNL